jgi:hypothetical protein
MDNHLRLANLTRESGDEFSDVGSSSKEAANPAMDLMTRTNWVGADPVVDDQEHGD